MLDLKELEKYGCDIKGSLERVLGDKELYFFCLNEFIKDKGFQNLGKLIEENKVEEAFGESHTLKGVAGNLGVTPIYETLTFIVEKLRKKSFDGILEDYKRLMIEFGKFEKIIKK